MSLGLVATAANPSFLAIHPNRRALYAVNESASGGAPGDTVVVGFTRPWARKGAILTGAQAPAG